MPDDNPRMPEGIPGFFTSYRIAILGLGLMGGSLALALHGKCAALIGIDPDPAALELTHQLKIFDQVFSEPDRSITQVDIVILAAHPCRCASFTFCCLLALVTKHCILLSGGDLDWCYC